MSELGELTQAIIDGNASVAEEQTRRALEQGTDPLYIFRNGLVPGMGEVGRRMQAGEYYIPEVLISARAMKAASAILKPIIVRSGADQPTGRVVIGTVENDLHDIGKNLVVMMLEGAGFEVTDLGINVTTEKFVKAVQEVRPHILGLSALITMTMVSMEKVIKTLEESGERAKIKIMVGGAPVTQRFSDAIGADGYSSDAAGAVELAKKFITATPGKR